MSKESKQRRNSDSKNLAQELNNVWSNSVVKAFNELKLQNNIDNINNMSSVLDQFYCAHNAYKAEINPSDTKENTITTTNILKRYITPSTLKKDKSAGNFNSQLSIEEIEKTLIETYHQNQKTSNQAIDTAKYPPSAPDEASHASIFWHATEKKWVAISVNHEKEILTSYIYHSSGKWTNDNDFIKLKCNKKNYFSLLPDSVSKFQLEPYNERCIIKKAQENNTHILVKKYFIANNESISHLFNLQTKENTPIKNEEKLKTISAQRIVTLYKKNEKNDCLTFTFEIKKSDDNSRIVTGEEHYALLSIKDKHGKEQDININLSKFSEYNKDENNVIQTLVFYKNKEQEGSPISIRINPNDENPEFKLMSPEQETCRNEKICQSKKTPRLSLVNNSALTKLEKNPNTLLIISNKPLKSIQKSVAADKKSSNNSANQFTNKTSENRKNINIFQQAKSEIKDSNKIKNIKNKTNRELETSNKCLVDQFSNTKITTPHVLEGSEKTYHNSPWVKSKTTSTSPSKGNNVILLKRNGAFSENAPPPSSKSQEHCKKQASSDPVKRGDDQATSMDNELNDSGFEEKKDDTSSLENTRSLSFIEEQTSNNTFTIANNEINTTDLNQLLLTAQACNQVLTDFFMQIKLQTHNKNILLNKGGHEQLKEQLNNIITITKAYTFCETILTKINTNDQNKAVIKNINSELEALYAKLLVCETSLNLADDKLSYFDAFPAKLDISHEKQYGYKEKIGIKKKREHSSAYAGQVLPFYETSTDVIILRETIQTQNETMKLNNQLDDSVYYLIIDSLEQYRLNHGLNAPVYISGDLNIITATYAAAQQMQFKDIQLQPADLNQLDDDAVKFHQNEVKQAIKNRKIYQDYNTARDKMNKIQFSSIQQMWSKSNNTANEVKNTVCNPNETYAVGCC